MYVHHRIAACGEACRAMAKEANDEALMRFSRGIMRHAIAQAPIVKHRSGRNVLEKLRAMRAPHKLCGAGRALELRAALTRRLLEKAMCRARHVVLTRSRKACLRRPVVVHSAGRLIVAACRHHIGPC